MNYKIRLYYYKYQKYHHLLVYVLSFPVVMQVHQLAILQCLLGSFDSNHMLHYGLLLLSSCQFMYPLFEFPLFQAPLRDIHFIDPRNFHYYYCLSNKKVPRLQYFKQQTGSVYYSLEESDFYASICITILDGV